MTLAKPATSQLTHSFRSVLSGFNCTKIEATAPSPQKDKDYFFLQAAERGLSQTAAAGLAETGNHSSLVPTAHSLPIGDSDVTIVQKTPKAESLQPSEKDVG